MDLLRGRMAEQRSLCVGLDSDVTKLPAWAADDDALLPPQFNFNRRIIDATKHLAVAFKPNIAFYRDADAGREALRLTIDYLRETAPEVPIILDAKRADIGNTNDGYVFEAFGWFGADAVTVNPYFGAEALQGFLQLRNKGVIILCRTSNPGAAELQNRRVVVEHAECTKWHVGYDLRDPVVTMPLYEFVAHKAAKEWNEHGNVCLVVGATAPAELARVRRIVGDMPLLIPGIGTQGGEVEAVVKAGRDSLGNGMIINASRAVIFAEDPGAAATELHEAILRSMEAA